MGAPAPRRAPPAVVLVRTRPDLPRRPAGRAPHPPRHRRPRVGRGPALRRPGRADAPPRPRLRRRGYGTWFYVAPGSGVKSTSAASSPLSPGRPRSRPPCASARGERDAPVRGVVRARGAGRRAPPTPTPTSAPRRGASGGLRLHRGRRLRRRRARGRGRRQELILCTQQSATPQCRACPAAVDLRRANGTRHVCGPEWRLPPVAPGVAPLRGLTCDRPRAQGVAGGSPPPSSAPCSSRSRPARGARAGRALGPFTRRSATATKVATRESAAATKAATRERGRDESRRANRGRDEGRDEARGPRGSAAAPPSRAPS